MIPPPPDSTVFPYTTLFRSTLTYALVSGGNAATAGTYGTIQVNSDGSYVDRKSTRLNSSHQINTYADTCLKKNITYKVTDANGNTATGTITVNIIDDVPTAH